MSRLRPRSDEELLEIRNEPRAALAHRGQHLLGDQERPTARDVLRGVEDLDAGRAPAAPCRAAGRAPRGSRRCRRGPPGRRPARGRGERLRDGVLRHQVELDDRLAPPCCPDGLRRGPPRWRRCRVVSTTRKPSLANFWATAPPTPQRMPTGRSLSSSALPWASLVLRPSACHLEVAPTTTATGRRVDMTNPPMCVGPRAPPPKELQQQPVDLGGVLVRRPVAGLRDPVQVERAGTAALDLADQQLTRDGTPSRRARPTAGGASPCRACARSPSSVPPPLTLRLSKRVRRTVDLDVERRPRRRWPGRSAC